MHHSYYTVIVESFRNLAIICIHLPSFWNVKQNSIWILFSIYSSNFIDSFYKNVKYLFWKEKSRVQEYQTSEISQEIVLGSTANYNDVKLKQSPSFKLKLVADKGHQKKLWLYISYINVIAANSGLHIFTEAEG